MMTENQWPQTPRTAAYPAVADPYGADPYGATEVSPQQASYPADSADASKTQAAREEASHVAGEAASAAQGVAQTAKTEAANVAQEAKANAEDLLHQAKSGLTSQAGTQQQKAAEGIRNISSQLHSMASAPDQQGVASDLVRQAAERTSSIASWLENREPGDLLDEVQRFARNRPGTFLLLAAGAGVLAGRLTRGLTAGAPEASSTTYGGTGTAGLSGQYSGTPYGDQYNQTPPVAGGTVPPPPVQLPGPATTTAGYDGGAPGSSYPESAGTASGL